MPSFGHFFKAVANDTNQFLDCVQDNPLAEFCAEINPLILGLEIGAIALGMIVITIIMLKCGACKTQGPQPGNEDSPSP